MLDASVSFDLAFDPSDHRQTRKARLAGVSPVRGHPADLVTNGVAARGDPAVATIHRLTPFERQSRRRLVEQHRDLGERGWPVLLQRQQVVPAAIADRLGDPGLSAHRINGDQGSLQVQTFEQQRNGGDFVGLLFRRLLAKDDPLTGGPGGDHVQRLAPLPSVVAAPRGLAIDRDDLRGTVAEVFNPGEEATFEQAGVDGREHVAQCVVAGNAVLVREETAEKCLIFLSPERGLHEIVRPGDRRGQGQKKNFNQRVKHFRMLTRVFEGGKMAQDRYWSAIGHGNLAR